MGKFMVTIRNSEHCSDCGQLILKEVVAQGTLDINPNEEEYPPFETQVGESPLWIYVTEM